jgi:hypothetical protein
MLRSRKKSWLVGFIALLMSSLLSLDRGTACAGITSEEVEKAIREGVRFLKDRQGPDGSWTDADGGARTGTTSLITIALLTA